MNDSSSFGYQDPGAGGSLQPAPPNQRPTLGAQYRFSADELRVLSECNQESFYQRSMPIGTVLGLGTYYGIQKGYLKPSQKFGVFPKVTLAVVVGYFLGKLSYQQACADKLMNLPGSYIGQLLRDRKDGKSGGGRPGMPNQPPTMFGAGPGDIYSDAGPGSSLNLDTDRPLFNDDTYRPGADGGGPNPSSEPTPPRPSLTYDELRRRNRGDYTEARQDPYKIDPNAMPSISRARPQHPHPESTAPSTNKYGDAME